MPVLLGVDLGTTTITAVALDARTGKLHARSTRPNHAEITAAAGKARGFSEWDAAKIVDAAYDCLRATRGKLDVPDKEIAGIGITGQQHGAVLYEENHATRPLLINWQDQRGAQPYAGDQTYVQRALELVGSDAAERTGCRLATGYLAVTLFWLRENDALPHSTRACFLTDYFAGSLTKTRPVTDPTNAAAGGVFDVTTGDWDFELLEALALSPSIVPDVRGSGERLGGLAAGPAETLGLAAGLPVFVGIGDNQASFLGAVASRDDSMLVNVGTGGQVAAYTDRFTYDPALETRPYPRGGYLVVCAGLCGGRSYALLEQFYREVGKRFFGLASTEPLYEVMNRLAAEVPPGAEGLCCAPFFTGTRAQPELRAFWGGVSATNFTPGHMARALMEGMAVSFQHGYEAIAQLTHKTVRHLVGSGNGLRENPVLAHIVAEQMALPLTLPAHREEAAYGAALLAAVGAGIYPDLLAAGRVIHYEDPVAPSTTPTTGAGHGQLRTPPAGSALKGRIETGTQGLQETP
jgi:sugar (pentulose or hexulose) kinase